MEISKTFAYEEIKFILRLQLKLTNVRTDLTIMVKSDICLYIFIIYIIVCIYLS